MRVWLILALVIAFFALRSRLRSGVDRAIAKGKKLLITGGGSGIGAEVAAVWIEAGGEVTITGRTESKLKDVCGRLGKDKCHYVVGDVASVDDCQKSVHEAARLMGGEIDFIIANHVTGRVAKLDEISNVEELYKAYRKTFDANVYGTLCLAKTGVEYLRKSKASARAFVQISSLSIFYGIARMSLYSGSKAAMHPIMNAFRVEIPQVNWLIHNVGHVTTDVANNAMPEKARNEGMPPRVCGELIVDNMLEGTREVFFPATYNPFQFPGFLAFLAGSFIPETMERLAQENYGKDFVKAQDQANPLAKATK